MQRQSTAIRHVMMAVEIRLVQSCTERHWLTESKGFSSFINMLSSDVYNFGNANKRLESHKSLKCKKTFWSQVCKAPLNLCLPFIANTPLGIFAQFSWQQYIYPYTAKWHAGWYFKYPVATLNIHFKPMMLELMTEWDIYCGKQHSSVSILLSSNGTQKNYSYPIRCPKSIMLWYFGEKTYFGCLNVYSRDVQYQLTRVLQGLAPWSMSVDVNVIIQ